MPSDIKVEKSLFNAIQEVRYAMSKLPLKKTGYNKHLGYYYFELGDFLPQATKLLTEAGLCTIFNIEYDPNGVEIATLSVVKGPERVVFTTPTAEVPNMQGIFGLGAKHTYCKRYLYVNLLDLTESDIADANNENTKAEPKAENKTATPKAMPKATPNQVEMIKGLYDAENIGKMLEYYNIQSLEELSLKQASEVIKRKTK